MTYLEKSKRLIIWNGVSRKANCLQFGNEGVVITVLLNLFPSWVIISAWASIIVGNDDLSVWSSNAIYLGTVLHTCQLDVVWWTHYRDRDVFVLKYMSDVMWHLLWSDEPFGTFIPIITEIYCYIGMHVSICSVIIRNQLWLILHWSQIKSASVNLYRYVPGQSLGRRKDYIKICFLKHFLISKSIFHNKSKR
jgi:hypothetical protein